MVKDEIRQHDGVSTEEALQLYEDWFTSSTRPEGNQGRLVVNLDMFRYMCYNGGNKPGDRDEHRHKLVN